MMFEMFEGVIFENLSSLRKENHQQVVEDAVVSAGWALGYP